ncbi:universal stress protein [Lactobacillus sp. DCY120]|uniref:Universal stress protein n=1 Tax=Bombilactobacillus apium TaxID=2675299 RepID=A0A850R231_9LACO|nr:universal stress protein [Bombilactobacillus apium]NVY96410.1 universal stress protein [Bombilactobacillus apium]
MAKDEQQLKEYRVQARHYHKILLAIDVDDFTSSQPAFDYGCSLALQEQAEVGITTVVESHDISVFDSLSPAKMDDKRLEAAHILLEYVKKAQAFGLEGVHPLLAEGVPEKAILEEVIPAFKPDLVVVGSEAKKINGKTIGLQAERIAEKAPISVLVVR